MNKGPARKISVRGQYLPDTYKFSIHNHDHKHVLRLPLSYLHPKSQITFHTSISCGESYKLFGDPEFEFSLKCSVNPKSKAVPWLRRLVAPLTPLTPGFDPGSVHVRFVVDKVALGQGFPRILWFYPVNFILPVVHYKEKRKTVYFHHRVAQQRSTLRGPSPPPPTHTHTDRTPNPVTYMFSNYGICTTCGIMKHISQVVKKTVTLHYTLPINLLKPSGNFTYYQV
jgi:hypothetical protein